MMIRFTAVSKDMILVCTLAGMLKVPGLITRKKKNNLEFFFGKREVKKPLKYDLIKRKTSELNIKIIFGFSAKYRIFTPFTKILSWF